MAKSSTPAAESAAATKPRHVYLVDGSGYIFRAYHALPPLTRSDGTPTNAVLGFTNMLWKLLEETDADHVAVIFDASRKTFRDAIYKEYKANRTETPEDLIPQFPLIREAVKAFNLPCIEMDGYEADDLIATYGDHAVEQGADVTIVSSDKDLMQLIRPGIKMWDPMKNRPIGPEEVQEKFGVTPDKVIDVQALCGDSTDNVPGVRGIGVKTAAELINSYGTLEKLLDSLGEIKQPKRRETLETNAELARISKQLVTLKHDVPVEQPLSGFAKRGFDPETLFGFLRHNEFRTTLTRVQQKLAERGGVQVVQGAAPRPAPVVKIIKNQVAEKAEPQAHSRENYQLITDEAALARCIADATYARKVAFDTETTAKQVASAELVGISLSIAPNDGCYIPVGHTGTEGDLLGGGAAAPKQLPLRRVLEMLKPLLEDPGVLKVGHSIKYDVAMMAKHGIKLAPIDDTMLISYVLEGALHAHNLDELASLHLGIDTIKYADVTGTGKAQVSFDKVPVEKARDYAAEDADVTLRLHHMLKPRLVTEHLSTVYETIERPLISVVAAMELAGIKVDVAELKRLSNDFGGRCAELESEIHKLAGTEFNIGSPKQLGDILFEKLKLGDGGKKGKTGAYSTGADILEELAGTSGHPLPQKVLDWRQLTKLKSTYTDALQDEINPRTGRVHTSYALAATSTGRLSSNDPNLQNIPIRTEEGRKIRHAFVAEKGMKLISVDYSQIELRLAAEMADIPALKQAFQDNLDIHAMTASQVFGVPIEGMDPMVRRRAKAINFGIIYGISPFGLAAQLGIPQADAKAYIAAYFGRFPGIRDYMERTKQIAREQGYVTTLFGRRCHVPGINDKNPARKSFMERAAINAPLQGTAADIIKRAMVRMPEAFAKAKLDARMLLQVHDELVFEAPESQAEETADLARKVMEGAALPARQISVPLIAEAGIADNWAEAH
ncbi:DNA polymerase I [Dongia sp.]|uniref:DNA polymerase I n=1 Tax=Dongia sp. TaxID=1977262 RepID=UPI00375009F6